MTTTALSSSFSRNRRTERLFFRFDYGQDRKTTRKSSHYLVFDFFCNDRHRVFFCWPFSTWQSLEPTWKRSSMEGFIKLDSFTPEILDGDQKGPTQSYFPRKRAFVSASRTEPVSWKFRFHNESSRFLVDFIFFLFFLKHWPPTNTLNQHFHPISNLYTALYHRKAVSIDMFIA